MRYYLYLSDGYIVGIGTGAGGTEITEAEYNKIMGVIRNRPEETLTLGYRLREDLTWESYEREPEPADDEIDDAEALSILLGGVT